ncbi:hypothetical protein O181_084256 [Austropuccinia psidii MF-1]|uniref:Gag-Pol-p199 n=1 Tax=Austropuccinia psidii MF-1 TaxID=1389203 RepID=A0A9Q3IIN5_9BASI|nr:hypothetical protein [Austropuccinia psidii MF-1]
MGDSKNMQDNDMNVIIEADKQAEMFHRFISLAEKIRPRLRADGANFNLWSKNMVLCWTTYFMGDSNYFQQPTEDNKIKRNLVARLFIEHSVEHDAYEAITSRIHGSDARKIYQALKDRFNRPSWSSVIFHANTIFQNRDDHVHDINMYAMTISEAVQNLENQLGKIDSEMITTLAIFFAVPSMQQHITPAINTLMATNPNLKVRPDDLLNMIRQIATASPNFDHSTEVARIHAASKFGTRKDFNNIPSNQSASTSHRKKETRAPGPRYPCHYCGEIGHWSPACPIRVKANDLRSKNRRQQVNIAGMGVVPALENGEALIDSGATHSVVGDLSLFTSWGRTDMKLSVASSESFKVNAIGSIALNTPYGLLRLNNVLYCDDIPGVILSLGHLLEEKFSISFLNHSFRLHNRHLHFLTIKRNNRWFIPFNNSTPPAINIKSVSPLICSTNSATKSYQDNNLLWHRRIGHLSIRHLRRMQKANIVSGLPHFPFSDVKLCHDCSLSKSQHRPIKSASRQIVNRPGDLIVADLMGPYEASLNNKKYILMIQDAFSWVVVAIPLVDKSEAKTYLINWIRQFLNVTAYKIITLRTDNGTEFKNHFLNDFLVRNGIIHEYSMPYEHHQNGQIERTNRTISEMARTCLLAANLPAFLWPWAFRHSVWIFNRYLHADDKVTPFEILGKKCPSLDLLRVFGAKSFIYEHNFRKDFSARATIGYHVGISEDSKGWLFWVPNKKTIVKSASVVFDEDTYYVSDIRQRASINLLQNGLEISIPSTYCEAMISDNKDFWAQAINEEIDSMRTENVFVPVDLHEALKEIPHESILSTKWVFTKKPERFKARLVARGFRQIRGINYDETFAPTPTFNSLRLLFSTACLHNWSIRTFDVKVAFLHSLIDKPVYIWPPMGFDVPKFKVLKLNKALYGTKQASRCWWMHLKTILRTIGFESNGEDPSTYHLNQGGEQAILWVHIDDGALTASSPSLLNRILDKLNSCLKIKWDAKINGLVGISITENDSGFKFSQPDLINKLTNLSPSNIIAKTPLPMNCKLVSNPSMNTMDKPYLKRIGILLYIAQASRPDIAFAVNYLARFSLHTDQSHWNALEHLIAYLRGTKDIGIQIDKNNKCPDFKCFVDANWGGEGNRSTHGYIILHGVNPIAWQSKQQTTIASSTAQAEYMALSFAARETLWIYHLLFDILQSPIPTLFSDNKTAIGISNESMTRKQTRHLIRDFNIINEYIAVGKLQLKWVSTNEQLGDVMTKPLGSIKHNDFVKKINSY